MTELKQLRIRKNLTQQEAADKTGVSLRSYISYENDEKKTDTVKYRYLYGEIKKLNAVDEEHGILSIEQIRKICSRIFDEYKIDFCYLFGSYAKGNPKGNSDIDLLISTEITGLRFFELAEQLRSELEKRVDLLDIKQVVNNEELLKDILKYGIKIYDKR
ncbi:MAG: nucleotidyltransferase domain-containing protein [Clostridiales bacterium]|nr:nucleotidyltransferase domain-containing protein [Clostridiales bacterium]